MLIQTVTQYLDSNNVYRNITHKRQTIPIFPVTRVYNSAVSEKLPLEDQQAFEDTKRVWFSSLSEGDIKRADGGTA